MFMYLSLTVFAYMTAKFINIFKRSQGEYCSHITNDRHKKKKKDQTLGKNSETQN